MTRTLTRNGTRESKARKPGIRAVGRMSRAAKLVTGWLQDGSGYDEAAWRELRKALNQNRSSGRKLFRE